jgi:DNA-binding NarL/FixJ family response regulator
MAINVLIADDHDIVREGIKSIIKTQTEYKVCAEARDGEQAVEMVRKYKPDILLLDITMPKRSGLDIIEQVKHISPPTKIIIITVHKMGAYILKALRQGVNGFFNKDNVVEELIPALSRVVTGGLYLGSIASEYLTETITQAKDKAKPIAEVLNQREQDILRLVAEGKTAREIAEILFLSPRTVENYKNNILKKLNLHKTSDLIKYAIKHKIVDDVS